MGRQPVYGIKQDEESLDSNGLQRKAAAIALPKGGGAFRGIGEKFAVSPVTGTGSTIISIADSLNRSSFNPRLSLSYDPGSGNGTFSFARNLSLPSIACGMERKPFDGKQIE